MYTKIDEGEVEIVLRGKPAEFAELYRSLSQWTPMGGWDPAAKSFFEDLKRAGRVDLRDQD